MNPSELFDLAEVDRRTRLPKPRELQVGTFVPPRELARAFLALRSLSGGCRSNFCPVQQSSIIPFLPTLMPFCYKNIFEIRRSTAWPSQSSASWNLQEAAHSRSSATEAWRAFSGSDTVCGGRKSTVRSLTVVFRRAGSNDLTSALRTGAYGVQVVHSHFYRTCKCHIDAV